MVQDNVSGSQAGRLSQAPQHADSRQKRRAAVSPNHQACTSCKRRKVRCDAARPRCSYCAAHDKPCIFPPVWRRAKCSQAHVEEIETKLREYESRYGRSSSTAPPETGHSLGQNNTSTLSVQNQTSTVTVSLSASGPPPGTQQLLVTSNSQDQPNGQSGTRGFVANNSAALEDSSSRPPSAWISSILSPVEPSSAPFPPQVDRPHEVGSRPLEQQPQQGPPDKAKVPDGIQAGVSTSPNDPVNDSDADIDSEADNQIMDGMVEYVGPSPEDMHAEDSFDTSPTFNFAMKIKASTLGEGARSTSGRSDLATSSEKAASAINTRVDPVSNGNSFSTVPLRPEHPTPQDTLQALKFYFNRSYLQYVPQRMVAKALLDRYFSAVNSVWPFLIEDVTRQRYDMICSSDEPPSPIWMAQLNLVFALACQFYESEAGAPLPDVYDAGKQHYLRGHGFVIAHAFDTCNVTMLQTLLLAVQYQQGTMRSNECWLTTGHATRMALGLGVHESSSANSGLRPLEIELRKRLWWGCFSLDRVCSMIYGRPIGIPHVRLLSSQDILPHPADDKYIAMKMAQPGEDPSINAFFVSSVELYRAMDEIIKRLHQISTTAKSEPNCNLHGDKQDPMHSSTSCCDAATQLAAILQLDGLLQNWHDCLPQHLKFSLDDVDPEDRYPYDIQRQRVILKIRFLGLRILLHRQTILFLLQSPEKRRWPRNASKKWPPLFSDDVGGPVGGLSLDDQGRMTMGHSSFEAQLAHLSAKMCVTSAQLQIEVIDHCRRLNLTGAWWWDFHFVFNALCVLFGAMGLRTEDHSAIVPELSKAQMLMQRGLSNIHDMASRGGSKVARSERFLRRLMKAALMQKTEPSATLRQGISTVARDGNNQAAARVAVESLPPAPSGTMPTSPMDLFGDDLLNRVDGFAWSPSANNAFAGENAQDLFHFYGNDNTNGTPRHEDEAIGNLLQSSFDTWTALGGAFQPPIDMDPVW